MTTHGDPDQDYSTAQVAALFGVGISTVQSWARSGALPSRRTKRGFRFSVLDVAYHRLPHRGAVKSNPDAGREDSGKPCP